MPLQPFLLNTSKVVDIEEYCSRFRISKLSNCCKYCKRQIKCMKDVHEMYAVPLVHTCITITSLYPVPRVVNERSSQITWHKLCSVSGRTIFYNDRIFVQWDRICCSPIFRNLYGMPSQGLFPSHTAECSPNQMVRSNLLWVEQSERNLSFRLQIDLICFLLRHLFLYLDILGNFLSFYLYHRSLSKIHQWKYPILRDLKHS